jgi:hypothetical protein
MTAVKVLMLVDSEKHEQPAEAAPGGGEAVLEGKMPRRFVCQLDATNAYNTTSRVDITTSLGSFLGRGGGTA